MAIEALLEIVCVADVARIVGAAKDDVIAHELIRHAVAHGLHIDERIAGDASTQTLLATWQRARRQGPQRRLLVADEAIAGPLMSRAVDALIGLGHPLGQVLLKRGERCEGAARQRIALHAGLNFAFRPRPIRRAGPWLHVPVATKAR